MLTFISLLGDTMTLLSAAWTGRMLPRYEGERISEAELRRAGSK